MKARRRIRPSSPLAGRSGAAGADAPSAGGDGDCRIAGACWDMRVAEALQSEEPGMVVTELVLKRRDS